MSKPTLFDRIHKIKTALGQQGQTGNPLASHIGASDVIPLIKAAEMLGVVASENLVEDPNKPRQYPRGPVIQFINKVEEAAHQFAGASVAPVPPDPISMPVPLRLGDLPEAVALAPPPELTNPIEVTEAPVDEMDKLEVAAITPVPQVQQGPPSPDIFEADKLRDNSKGGRESRKLYDSYQMQDSAAIRAQVVARELDEGVDEVFDKEDLISILMHHETKGTKGLPELKAGILAAKETVASKGGE